VGEQPVPYAASQPVPYAASLMAGCDEQLLDHNRHILGAV
jgi:hypothetical protein